MKAKIVNKSNVTANGNYELLFDVISDDEAEVIYPNIRIYCNVDEDITTKIQARIVDIINAQKVVEDLPEVIELPENGDIS